MTYPQHTPGPWTHDMGFIVAPDPSGIHLDIYIAEIAAEDSEGRIASHDEQMANAALIVVAPELLAALTGLLESPDLNLGNLECETLDAIEQAVAAITKATARE